MKLLAIFILVMAVPSAGATSEKAAIATAHPLATVAGMSMLEAGGNAVDAAVSVSFTLSVVEPWSSGIGGGAFIVVRMGDKTRTWDLRETAPEAATREMFVKDDKVVPGLSTKTGLAVGIPGLVRGLVRLHKEYGALPLKDVMAPAIRLAREGFPVSARLHEAIVGAREGMNGPAKRIFLRPDLKVPSVGSVLKQLDLAKTLTAIANTAGLAFYEGELAKELVAAVRAEGGIWTLSDLKSYRVKERPPVKGLFKGLQIHSMGPPSSGGLLLVQMLSVREKLPPRSDPSQTAYVHEMVETTKRAFALRAYELGDPDFHAVRSGVFLSTGAIQQTAGQVSQAKRATAASAIGKVRVQATDRNDTSHFGILLANGDAVACTQTINLRFGSGLVAGRTGVVLNNEMDDFSALPGVPNSFGLIGAEANSIAPRKRPLSSMTPTLVIRDGKTVGVFGTPGGSTIITTTYQSIINVVEHGWGVKKALAFPRLHHQWFPDKIFFEKGRLSEANQAALMALGHRLSPSRSIGNAMAIWKDVSGKIEAAADPRGEGTSQVR